MPLLPAITHLHPIQPAIELRRWVQVESLLPLGHRQSGQCGTQHKMKHWTGWHPEPLSLLENSPNYQGLILTVGLFSVFITSVHVAQWPGPFQRRRTLRYLPLPASRVGSVWNLDKLIEVRRFRQLSKMTRLMIRVLDRHPFAGEPPGFWGTLVTPLGTLMAILL